MTTLRDAFWFDVALDALPGELTSQSSVHFCFEEHRLIDLFICDFTE